MGTALVALAVMGVVFTLLHLWLDRKDDGASARDDLDP